MREFDVGSPFVGRDDELERLAEFAAHPGPVWVWGPPGVGKSRFVAEWASRRDAESIVIDLGTCRGPAELHARIAERLGLVGSPDESEAATRGRLLGAIERATAPLVLDDVDPVRAAAESLIVDARASTVVVTCRSAPADATKVKMLELAPLPTDDARGLFEMRAQHVNPHVALDPADVTALVERLDRLPLAIELAAGRLTALTVSQVTERLDERFELLGGGRTDSRRSLKETLEWTWHQLGSPERDLLAQCAIFRDSFSLMAAEAIVGSSGSTVLDVVEELVRTAWIMRSVDDVAGELRFQMLGAISDLARDHASLDLLEEAGGRAVGYYLEATGRWREAIEGPTPTEALRRMERERENILGVVDQALHRADDRALLILENMRWNAFLIGPAFRYEALIERGRRLATASPPEISARFLEFSASFTRILRRAWGMEDASRAVEAAERSGDPALRARAEITLGECVSFEADGSALGRYRSAERGARSYGLHVERGRALERIGFYHLSRFELAEAETALRDAVECFREHSNGLFAINSQCGLAWTSFRRGRLRAAASRFEAALEQAEGFGLSVRVAACAFNLAFAQHALGDLEDAETSVQKALSLWRRLGFDGYLAAASLELARILWDGTRYDEAFDVLRSAARDAARSNDPHNRAVAAGLSSLFRWARDGACEDGELVDTIEVLDVEREPITVAAHLAAIVGMRAARGIPSLRELNRIEEISAHLSHTEGHVAAVTARLLTIGYVFTHCSDAKRAANRADEGRAASEARRQLSNLANPAEPSDLLRVESDFYVRFLLPLAARLVDQLDVADVDSPDDYEHDVVFHPNCHWVRIDGGDPIELSSRNQLRLLVKTLAKRHFANPHGTVSVEELLEVGWPGEYVTRESGRSRIYTAIRDLRKMGFADLIVTGDGGYRLAPGVRFRVAPHTGIVPP